MIQNRGDFQRGSGTPLPSPYQHYHKWIYQLNSCHLCPGTSMHERKVSPLEEEAHQNTHVNEAGQGWIHFSQTLSWESHNCFAWTAELTPALTDHQ